MLARAKRQPRTTWVGISLATYAIVSSLLLILMGAIGTADATLAELLALPACITAAVLASLAATRSKAAAQRRPWWLVAVALEIASIAGMFRAWEAAAAHALSWMIALGDLLSLAFYAFLIVGLWSYPHHRWDGWSRIRVVLDVAAIGTAALLPIWILRIVPLLTSTSGESMQLVLPLAHAAAELLMIVALARAFLSTPQERPCHPIYLLAASAALFVIVDLAGVVLTSPADGGSWTVFAVLRVIGFLTAAGAGLCHMARPQHSNGATKLRSAFGADRQAWHRSPQFLALPLLTCALLVVLLSSPLSDMSLQRRGLIAMNIVLVGLLVARQAMTLAENRAANQELQTFSRILQNTVQERTAELASEMEKARRLNLELEEANAELRQADRVKSEFVSNVAHELRTPLSAILGYLELLQDEDGDPLTESQNRSLEVVTKNSNRLLDLVNELLDVNRMESGRFSVTRAPLDIMPLLAQIADEAVPQAAQRRIKFETDLVDGVPAIIGDRRRLTQVIMNFISNAIKFTPSGGKIVLKSSYVTVMHGISSAGPEWSAEILPHLTEGNWLIVCVQDNGPGIPMEEQTRLFTRFYRTESAQRTQVPGTGLGLYVARMIIEAHGGLISVASQPGRGSRFWFALSTPVINRSATSSSVSQPYYNV